MGLLQAMLRFIYLEANPVGTKGLQTKIGHFTRSIA